MKLIEIGKNIRVYECKGLREAILFAAMFRGFLSCESKENIWTIVI